MNIAGFQKLSTVDWPGNMAAVVFTPGCTMNCAFCHNRMLLEVAPGPGFPVAGVLDTLEKRRGFLDGVVITGGEPTMQPRLESFIRAVRRLGFAVKLDTNGARPGVLRGLMARNLIDYVAMDVKAPWDLYEDVCGGPVDLGSVKSSIRCLIKGSTPYEFRTTVLPHFRPEDISEIGRAIAGAKRYVLQQFRPHKEIAVRDPRLASPPHTAQWFAGRVAELRTHLDDVSARGIDLRAVQTA